MKYFLCAFDRIFLAIPSDCAERIIPVSEIPLPPIEDGSSGVGKRELLISLPHLFGRPEFPAPHGIVLKSEIARKKAILLVPPIDVDIDIAQNEIHSIPISIGRVLSFCEGIFFIVKNQEERLVLTLRIESLKGISDD